MTRKRPPSKPHLPALVIAAAPADAALADRLRAHLRPLERAGLFGLDRDVGVAEADIALLLVSIDFLNGGVVAEADMEAALERNRRRIARVVPVIARPCLWEMAPFAELPSMPPAPRTIATDPSEEAALAEIAGRLRGALAG